MKKGFGLLEVLIAAVVLGFLIVGLNNLQKGNREGVLRVRARDAANLVAQRVLDSLGSLGINSIQENAKPDCGGKSLVHCEPKYTYSFGNPTGMSAPIDYTVEVALLSVSEEREAVDTTLYTKAINSTTFKNAYAKSLEATVSWVFKKGSPPQSIKMAKVVR